MRLRQSSISLAIAALALTALTSLAAPPPPPAALAAASPAITNPFYAMDTCTNGTGLTAEQQLDLVKETGYAGTAWHECGADEAKSIAEQAEKRGLKMFAIYCPVSAGSDGATYSERVKPIIAALKGHDTILWIHIGSKSAGKAANPALKPPAPDSLKGDEPVIRDLQALADFAAQSQMRIAIYPHAGEWTAKFKDALAVAKAVKRDNFGVTFNLCHALATGDEKNIPALLEEAGPLLTNMTISGADAGITGSNWKQLIQTLDKGSLDIAPILAQLQKQNFKGPIGLQGYGLTGDKKANLEASMKGWKKLTGAIDPATAK